MDFSSLPQHPGQPAESSRPEIPTRQWSVVWLRVGQLAALLTVLGVLAWLWWLFYRIFRGGPWVGTFFA